MLLYVVFILLPATALALAECKRDVYWTLFNYIDWDKNNEVSQDEYDYFFHKFDINRNGVITVREMRDKKPFRAPPFQAEGQAVFDFLNVDETNEHEVIDSTDKVVLFRHIDTDKDGNMSKEEFASYLETYCKELEP